MLSRLLLHIYLLCVSLWSLITPTTCFQSSIHVWQKRHVPAIQHGSKDFPRLSSCNRVLTSIPRPSLTSISSSQAFPSIDDVRRGSGGNDERLLGSSASKIISAALLIAGTAVGGGFLALPAVVAPTGFFPSALTMVCVWAFLGGQAWTVIEVLCAVNEKKNSDVGSAPPGLAAAARATFGVTGERIVTFLLVLVVEATLVSQISRAGLMLKESLYRVGCSLAAISVGAVVFGPRTEKRRESIVTFLNSILMIVLSTVAVALFAVGIPAADWSRLSAVQNYKNIPQMIPTCLQLLCYGEILATVCQYLNFNKGAIRLATGLGSVIPIILELGWAALGIGLGAGMSGQHADPVALLLQEGPIRIPLFCFALSAILTTILGSYLALQSTVDDVLKGSRMRGRQLFSASLIVLPALAIASISPSLFLQAIDFAGSYPVVLLWGIGPPLMALRLKNSMGMKFSRYLKRWIPISLSLSVLLFGMSAVPDVGKVANWMIHSARCLL